MIAISYRREDSLPVTGRLYDRLEQRFGKQNVFMDFDSIRPGFDFRDQIKETIERSKVVIAVIGPDWLGKRSDGTRRIDDPTDFVRLEMACALQSGIPLIPVLVNNTAMPKADTLPSDIQALAFRHALPLDSGLDFRQHADRLINSISDAVRRPSVGAGVRKRKPWLIGAVVAFVLVLGAVILTKILSTSRSPAKSEPRATNSMVSPRTPATGNQAPPTQPDARFTRVTKAQDATKERPFENSLGMKFVPVPGTKVLFSIWDTRVQDYDAFVEATHRAWQKPDFSQTPKDPAVNVSWDDSKAFCAWLTEIERTTRTIDDNQEYRLPTDKEWSVAVGGRKYPWGNEWPPPRGAGNYGSSVRTGEYEFTSPVGSFAANEEGLYDMGGNVWQWCEDLYDKTMNDPAILDKWPHSKTVSVNNPRVVRGAAWYYYGSAGDLAMLSSFRDYGQPNTTRGDYGFRCVLAPRQK